MSLYQQPHSNGDLIEVISAGDHYRLNTNTRIRLEPGMPLQITRIYRDSVVARTRHPIRVPYGPDQHASFQFSNVQVRLLDPNAPPPRRLGHAPTREEANVPEGVEVIGPDHPGIQWLFNDMGAFADEQGYCSQYDALCVKLGIPGRPREFDVQEEIDGLLVAARVRARSLAEAKAELQKRLAAYNVPAQGPVEEERETV